MCSDYHESARELTNPSRFPQILFVLGCCNVVRTVLRTGNWLNHFQVGFSGKRVLTSFASVEILSIWMVRVSSPARKKIFRRVVGDNLWLGLDGESNQPDLVARLSVQAMLPEILETEEAVAQAQFDEIQKCAAATAEDVVLVLLGGRGAQALYRLMRRLAESAAIDPLLRRLHVFTQDALAPMRMNNGLSFVRDFERLLGDEFFSKVKSFTPMRTDTDDLEGELVRYISKIESLGGIDICLLGLGPEAGARISPGVHQAGLRRDCRRCGRTDTNFFEYP